MWACLVKPLADGVVEVELYATGLNYKDVVVSMGSIPGDETQLGYEAASAVKQVSKGASNYAVGDHVMVWGKGAFANRIHTTPTRFASPVLSRSIRPPP